MMKKTISKNISLLLLAAAFMSCALTLTGCDKLKELKEKKASGKKKTADAEEVIYAVNAYKISEGNLDDYLEFGGDVNSVSSVDVLPDQAGKLSRKLVSVGDMVSKDQVIAYVDASRPGLNYKASPVKAPISGRIVSFAPAIGSTVSQAYSIAKISMTDDLEINASVPERFISRICEGQVASLSFDSYPSVVFFAHVTEVAPVLDTSTRTMSIKLTMDEKDERVKIGMYARIKLITDSITDAIVIPASTVVTRDGESYVFVIEGTGGTGNGTVRLQKIVKGITVDNKTEVTDGLSAGQLIISKGQTLVNNGSKVNVLAVDEASK